MWPFGKKKRKAAKIKVGPCEITYYDRDGRPMSEAEVERERRRTELARIEREAEQEARRSARAALGANVGALTDERLTVDALDGKAAPFRLKSTARGEIPCIYI